MSKRNRLSVLFVGFFLSMAVMHADAASGTKTDTTTMNTTADWSAGALGTADIGTFDSTISAINAASLSLGGNISIGGLVFGSNLNGPVTIASGSTLTLNGATSIDMSSANQNVTINSAVALGTHTTWIVGADQTLSVGGIISGVTKSIAKQGSGSLVLSGSNTWSHSYGIYFTNGTLRVEHPQGLGNALYQLWQGADAMTLDLRSDLDVTFGGSNGAYVFYPFSANLANGTFNVDPLTTGSGKVIEIGGLGRDTTYDCIYSFTSGNNYTLSMGKIIVANMRQTWLRPTTAMITIGTINGNSGAGGTSTLNMQGTGTGTVTGAVTDGPSGGKLNVTKSDSSTWILGGMNTYTGTTAVSGGKLLVNGTHTGGGNYTVTVGTLGGSGTIGSSISMSSGATLAPGGVDGFGVLTVSNDTSVASGRIFEVKLGDLALQEYSQLRMGDGATVTLGGTLSIDDSAARGYGTITIVNVSELGGTRDGVFSNYSDGATYAGTCGNWTLHYASNGDVTLTLPPKGTVISIM